MMRRLAVVLGLCAALVPAAGWAVCNKSNLCTAAALLADPACCGATLCTIDGTVTVSGPTCTFDFDGRRLSVSGQLVVGSRDVLLKADRVEVTGKIDARGTPGGNVTIQTTGAAVAPLNAFSMSGGPATQIDVSGTPAAPGGRSAGSVVIQANGPITLAGSGSILANALDANSGGGLILIQSKAGAASIDVTLSANAGLNGVGGAVIIDAPAGLQLTGTINANGDQGSIDVGAVGALSVGGGARLSANAFADSGADGGAIDISAASVDMRGILEAMGGRDASGDIGGTGGTLSIVATSGPLSIVRGTLAISVSGAFGADGGEIELSTNSQANGDITINAPIEAIGRGGVGELFRTSAGGIVSANASRSLFVRRNVNAMGSGDLGGELELVARGDFLLTGSLNVNDLSGSGFVSIEATEGDVTIDGNLQAKASGDGEGGTLDVTAGNDLTVTGTRVIEVSGATTGRGGSIDLRAGRHLTIARAAELHADAGSVSGTSGGNVSLFAGSRPGDPGLAGNLTIDGIVTATGRPPTTGTSFLSSTIDLGGCTVLLSSTAFVDSTGDTDSTNRVTARTSVRVNTGGKLKATGSNVATYPVGTPPVTGANTVDPPFTSACPGGCARVVCTGSGDPEGCLVPCPNCGNGVREFPESLGCDPPGCNRGCDSHCRRLPDGCDDGKPCTTDSCDSDPDFGCLREERDGQPCDNGTVCDGREVCVGDVCDPGEPLDCDDSNPCTAETCSAAGGCSGHTPLTGNPPGCDNACVERCVLSDDHPPAECKSITPPDCNDNNPNTNDFCDPADGTCHHETGASCTSTAQCNDNNPCTVDSCPEGTLRFCRNEPLGNGTPCPNSTVCDGGETCQNGSCVPGTSLDCDDQDACTEDVCDPISGCSNTAIPNCCETVGDCNDDNPCTNDACESHSCANIPDSGCCATDGDCNDNNPCTDDSACVNQRCTNPDVTGERPGCGDACRDGTCQAGTCQLSDPIVCTDDGDVCTDDFCDGDTGCVHLAIPECCRGDVAGECGDACTFCDPEPHRCGRLAGCRTCTRDSECDPDGRCAGRACGNDGLCADAPATECSDGNPETSDVCRLDANDQPVCDHRCLTARVCDDGNACNGAETCSSGACVAGTVPACDDGDPCTDNTCVAPGGCQNPAKTGFASARCRFERMTQALAGAAPADVAAPIRSKLEKLLGAAGTNLDAAEGASTPKKAKRKLSAVRKQLKKIGKVVRGALRKRKISPPLADVILGVVDDGVQAVDGLRTP